MAAPPSWCIAETARHSACRDRHPVATLPRLTDYLRLTNGLADRALDLLPRLAQLPHRARSRRCAAAGGRDIPISISCCLTACAITATRVTGGKKTASGPLAMKREAARIGRRRWQARESAARRAAGAPGRRSIAKSACSKAELERLRALQQAREKDALALDHEMRKLAEETARVQLADFRRAAGTGSPAAAKPSARVEQRERNREAVAEKETARAQSEQALEAQREELEKLEAAGRAALREEHAALRAELAGLEERHRARTAAMGRVEAQLARSHRRAARTRAARSSGWASSARACWPITSSWTASPPSWPADIAAAEAAVNRLAPRKRMPRDPGGAGRKAEGAARDSREPRTRSARRSKSIW